MPQQRNAGVFPGVKCPECRTPILHFPEMKVAVRRAMTQLRLPSPDQVILYKVGNAPKQLPEDSFFVGGDGTTVGVGGAVVGGAV